MKILAVFTGGTIGCSRVDGVLSPDSANAFALLEMYRTIDGDVSFEAVYPYTILSENLCAENLKQLYDCIKSYDLSRFDGVIVAHGTDTLQYSAAFLAFKLGLTEVPIVLVSANYPLGDSRSNGLENFSGAVDFIRTGQGKGVFIVYQNTGDSYVTVHRATRALPQLPYSDSVFSMLDSVYGRVENGSFAFNPDFTDDEEENLSACELSGHVLYLKAYVGMRFPEIEEGTKAVLLEGYHSGTLNTAGEELRAFCVKARERGVPVYLTGACDGFDYESKLAFDELNIQALPPMSPIAAYVKLWLSGI